MPSQVYYLILAWTVLATLAMLYPDQNAAGADGECVARQFRAGAVHRLRPAHGALLIQFALSGFFAGIGGGLYAITYEIVTFDALAAPLSANALLMAYIGGTASFGGPILGAVLITLLQSGVSLLSNSWLVYVGVMFITMVIFAPSGIVGLIQAAHGPIVRAGQLGRLAVPYVGWRSHRAWHPAGARLCRPGGIDVVPDHRRCARASRWCCSAARSMSTRCCRGWWRRSACWAGSSGCGSGSAVVPADL